MVQTDTPKAAEVSAYVVLRPICMGGERVEVGGIVQLTRQQGTELAAAAKVAPAVERQEPEPAPAPKPSKAKAD